MDVLCSFPHVDCLLMTNDNEVFYQPVIVLFHFEHTIVIQNFCDILPKNTTHFYQSVGIGVLFVLQRFEYLIPADLLLEIAEISHRAFIRTRRFVRLMRQFGDVRSRSKEAKGGGVLTKAQFLGFLSKILYFGLLLVLVIKTTFQVSLV